MPYSKDAWLSLPPELQVLGVVHEQLLRNPERKITRLGIAVMLLRENGAEVSQLEGLPELIDHLRANALRKVSERRLRSFLLRRRPVTHRRAAADLERIGNWNPAEYGRHRALGPARRCLTWIL